MYLAAHGAGDEAVVLAVQQQYGYVRVLHGLHGAGAAQVKAAEKPGGQTHKGHDRAGERHVLRADAAYYRLGRGVGAVRHYSRHVLRQRQFRGHEHARRAHGDADEEDGHIAEALLCVLRPGQAVAPLLDAEGYRVPAAAAVGALVYQQDVVPGLERQPVPAAEVAQRVAAVAVELDLQWRAVAHVVIAGVQLHAVEGADADRLERPALQLGYQCAHFVSGGLVLLALGQGVGVVVAPGTRIERRVIGKKRHAQRQDKKRAGGYEQPHR